MVATMDSDAPAPRHRYTFKEYLELEEIARARHEFCDGEIYALTGGTPEHAAAAVAITMMIGRQLGSGPCRVYSSALRVRVPATGLATYADVAVICGALERDPESSTHVTNPTAIFEVLSSSIAEYGRAATYDTVAVAGRKVVSPLSFKTTTGSDFGAWTYYFRPCDHRHLVWRHWSSTALAAPSVASHDRLYQAEPDPRTAAPRRQRGRLTRQKNGRPCVPQASPPLKVAPQRQIVREQSRQIERGAVVAEGAVTVTGAAGANRSDPFARIANRVV
jgi:hypothetical protein